MNKLKHLIHFMTKSLILNFIFIFLLVLSGCSVEESSNSTNKPASTQDTSSEPQLNWTKAGMYKIGDDLPAGEYFVVLDGYSGYYQVTTDSSGSLDSIISNDNFSSNRYITVSEGQYLKLQRAKAILVDDAPTLTGTNGIYPDGMYKIGRDLTAGEYYLKAQVSSFGLSYYETSSDSTGLLTSILSNDNFSTNRYISVTDGQYLLIKNATLVSADEAPQPSPVDVKYEAGMFKIGIDLPAGEYKVVADGSVPYVEVSSDCTGSMTSIVTNDLFQGETYITVSEGQYLIVNDAYIVVE